MRRALPRSAAMNPVVAKMPVPTMLEMTSAVALKNPICLSKPGRDPCDLRVGIPRPGYILCRMRTLPDGRGSASKFRSVNETIRAATVRERPAPRTSSDARPNGSARIEPRPRKGDYLARRYAQFHEQRRRPVDLPERFDDSLRRDVYGAGLLFAEEVVCLSKPGRD